MDPDDEDAVPTYQQITGGLSEDEEDLDEQETFEAQHNFRWGPPPPPHAARPSPPH